MGHVQASMSRYRHACGTCAPAHHWACVHEACASTQGALQARMWHARASTPLCKPACVLCGPACCAASLHLPSVRVQSCLLACTSHVPACTQLDPQTEERFRLETASAQPLKTLFQCCSLFSLT